MTEKVFQARKKPGFGNRFPLDTRARDTIARLCTNHGEWWATMYFCVVHYLRLMPYTLVDRIDAMRTVLRYIESDSRA